MGLGGARGIDRIGGFAIAPEIDDGAVREPDAERAGRRHRAVHPCGNIVELAFAEKRRRQKKSIVVERKRRRREVEVDVGRQPELRDAIPHALGTVRIVVAGQQVPVNIGERLHALDRRAQRVRVGSLAVVNVAGDEDVMNAIALGVRAESLDGRETRLPQRLFLGAELFEDLADLPIGGMNESHYDFPLLRRCHRFDVLTSGCAIAVNTLVNPSLTNPEGIQARSQPPVPCSGIELHPLTERQPPR